MSNLADEMNVNPKRRITIPEGSRAIIIPEQLAEETRSVCITLRKLKALKKEEFEPIRGVLADLLLAIVEAENAN
jgi:predicted DNA-binding antitoxin AbrB/MazE fold protein